MSTTRSTDTQTPSLHYCADATMFVLIGALSASALITVLLADLAGTL
jgi:hypothetical protein